MKENFKIKVRTMKKADIYYCMPNNVFSASSHKEARKWVMSLSPIYS